MTTVLYANPYDLSAEGFYFHTLEMYHTKAKNLKNDYGSPVEEFSIEFIDGDDLDCAFAKAWGLNQANIGKFFEAVRNWDDYDKRAFIVVVGECGYSFDPDNICPEDFVVDLYEVDSLKELAEQFVEEGLYGEIPDHLQFYIDYEAIGRDLSADYAMITIAGNTYAYICG